MLVKVSENVEIKIAPGMVTDLYVASETAKNKLSTKKETTENKTSFLSGIFGNKK